MEIDKVFSSDVDGVADNLFSAVKNSVSEIKAMQQRKAAENVQLVIQALKKIESDLQDKFDGVTTVIEKRVATIKDGRDGLDGRNGRDGKDGRPGRDGAPGARGPAGVPGTNGRDGEDGVSVTDARIDFDGSLIISLSSGREINVGEVVAPDLAEKIKVITNGGGTSQSVLDTLASLQAQITAISNFGYVNYVGTWNANTNSPTITSGSGDKGDYYVVSVAGFTNIDGQTLWGVGDWIIFNGSVWQKVDGGSTGDFTNLSASGTVTFTGLNASQAVFTNGSDELVSNAITGTGNVVMSASPTLTGTASLAALTTSSTVTHNGGTANGVAYLNGSKVLTTGSALTFDGSTFGVATTAGNMALFNSTAANGGYLTIQRSGVSKGYIGSAAQLSGGSNDDFTVRAEANLVFSLIASEQMRLTSTGLGIGTSSPGAKLDVNGGTNSEMRLTTSGSGYLQVGQFTNGAFIGTSSSDATAGQLRLGTGGASQVWLSTTGNLGIGTSSPDAKLDVTSAGSAAAYTVSAVIQDGTYPASGNPTLEFNGFIGGNGYRSGIGSIGGQQLAFYTPSTFGVAPTRHMTLNELGNLGIGTSSPQGLLDVRKDQVAATRIIANNQNASNGASTNFDYYYGTTRLGGLVHGFNVSGAYLNIDVWNGSAATTRATFDSSGNLGLGVTPSAWSGVGGVFEVKGNSYIYSTTGVMSLGANAYFNGTNWIYKTTQAVTRYEQVNGQHQWSYAASGTAGNAISFTQAMTLDASGNLVLGATSANARLDVVGGSIRVNEDTIGTKIITVRSDYAGLGPAINVTTSHPLLFLTANTERARIYADGQFQVSSTLAGSNLLSFTNSSATGYGISMAVNNDSSGTYRYFEGYSSSAAAQRIAIYTNGDVKNTNGVFAAFSDVKLKKDIVDAGSQWDDIKALRVRKYKLKNDANNVVQIGLIAQEVEQVSPGLVDESQDEIRDEDGKIVLTGEVTKGVKYSILYMKAVKALQEAMARIETLEAKVAQLEGTQP